MPQDVIVELDDPAIEAELAKVMRRKLDRLAKAQALAWNSLTREAQLAFLMTVDRLEDRK
jgi:hypothetical protein